MRFIAIIAVTCLLIFIEYKFEVIDYLRFVNSAKTLEGSSIAYGYSSDGEIMAVAKKFTPSETREYRNSSRKKFKLKYGELQITLS